MKTICVCETHSSAHIYEYEVARRWYALPAGVFLPLSNGDFCQLLFAGHPGSAAGPDVQDAVLHFSQSAVHAVGDIEFHVRASDWFAHQHHRDARYNNVLLHVVLICDTSAPILRQDGSPIPMCSLYDLALPHLPISQTSWPCHAVLPYMSHTELFSLLTQAGMLRFEQKAHAFVEQLHTAHVHVPFSAYDECLIVALAEGLGYGRNRAFFRATGQYLLGLIDTVPEPLGHTFDPPYLDASRLAILRKLVEQWRTMSAWEMVREILLNREARRGGCGADAGGGPLWPPVGEVEPLPTGEGGRAATRAPAPHHTTPAPTRLSSDDGVGEGEPGELPTEEAERAATRASAPLHTAPAPTRLSSDDGVGEGEPGELPTEGGGRAATRAPAPHRAAPAPTRLLWDDRVSTRDPLDSLRAIFSGMGKARADILICNVVLPFAMAVGLIENDQTLVMQAQRLYQTYPSLSSNRVTRAMFVQLQLPNEPPGACQQQGLHYIYQQTCKEKRCDECIVGRRQL